MTKVGFRILAGVMLLLGATSARNVEAQTFSLLHSLVTSSEGSWPNGLVEGPDHNFYGTTQTGGQYNFGTIFRMGPGNLVTSVYAFTGGADGRSPEGNLVLAPDGNFYGTTTFSGIGASTFGTVFRFSPSGDFSTIYAFDGQNGRYPSTSMVVGPDGWLYGTTSFGANCTVFMITTDGAITTLHQFTSLTEGDTPSALIFGSDRNLYGTNNAGGAFGEGTVFKMTPDGTVTILHTFTGPEGAYPLCALTQGRDGNLYGSTGGGGPYRSNGTVFQLTLDGTYTLVHSFNGIDGDTPFAALVQGKDGLFYGTTYEGGPDDIGTIFSLASDGTYQQMHTFDGTDGVEPASPLIFGSDGNLYGVTTEGATRNIGGTIFRLTMPDTSTPTTSISLQGTTDAGGVYTRPVAVTLSATDPDGTADVGATYYTIDGGSTTTYAAPFTLSASGSHTISYWSVDAHGNVETAKSQQLEIGSFLSTIAVTPQSVTGGALSVVTITLNGPAPVAGAVVKLSTSSAAAAAFSTASVTLAAGVQWATVPLSTFPVTSTTSLTLTAKYGVSHTCHVTVVAPKLSTLKVSPSKVVGGSTSTGTITLTGATAADTPVSVTSNNGAATIAGPVVVVAGQSTATFSINTSPVAVNADVAITATLNGGTATAPLTVKIPVLDSIKVSPATVHSGGTTTATATLQSPAPAGGMSVNVVYVNASALSTAPTSITVAGGSTTGTATIIAGIVSTQTAVTLSATLGTTNKSTTLTVKP